MTIGFRDAIGVRRRGFDEICNALADASGSVILVRHCFGDGGNVNTIALFPGQAADRKFETTTLCSTSTCKRLRPFNGSVMNNWIQRVDGAGLCGGGVKCGNLCGRADAAEHRQKPGSPDEQRAIQFPNGPYDRDDSVMRT